MPKDTDTPPGSSPAAAMDAAKQYRPADHESRIWQRWEDARAFHADPERVLSGEAEPYCVLIPPPNVTAALHLGHALNNSLQDILVRAHRMMGFETLWMPGTDHAGIATQAVVEKRVQKEEKKRRTDFTREEFVAKIQAFKDEYEATITNQLKRMGCSCDWDRQRFTMDPVCARAVREAFFRLFKDGLIYRGKRLVNWDPVLQTAVADDECYDEEIDAAFYYLRYPLVHPHGASTQRERLAGQFPPDDAVPVTWSELERLGYAGAEQHPSEEQAYVTVATTRPETYLADTAVAVNPNDPRAKALRGLCVELPLLGRVIPIVEDDYVVMPSSSSAESTQASGAGFQPASTTSTSSFPSESEDPKAKFATGFLKVTPGHDQNDYDLYQRHKDRIDTFATTPSAGLINMMSPDGRVSDQHGWSDIGDAHLFVGKKMAEARKLVVDEFKARTVTGSNVPLFAESKPYRHSIKHSDRSKAVIEPYLSDQWYVRVTDPRMAQAANEALVPEQRSSSPSPPGRGQGEGLSSSPHHSSSKDPHPNPLPQGEGADNHLRFFPARYAKTYEQWHDNIRDWCISRQLWWGHRIPVWTITVHVGAPNTAVQLGKYFAALGLNNDVSIRTSSPADEGGEIAICSRSESSDRALEALNSWYQLGKFDASAELRFTDLWARSSEARELGREVMSSFAADPVEQDPDVLDTWFSSALWPLSTLGWPDPEWASAQTTQHQLHRALPTQARGAGVPPASTTSTSSPLPSPSSFQGLLQAFNPTASLSTAREIITLWVSRMVMMNQYFRGNDRCSPAVPAGHSSGSLFTKKDHSNPAGTAGLPARGLVPFRDVYIHAVIQDGEGRKMSKTLGNGVDPLDIIATHGADAMRFTLCHMATNTQDVRLPVKKDASGRNTSEKFDLGRNFANKLWNAARFVMGILHPLPEGGGRGVGATPASSNESNGVAKKEHGNQPTPLPPPSGRGSLADRWMLSRLENAVQECNAALAEYRFADYAQTCYDLLWRDFCDWYLEAIKPTVAEDAQQRAVLRATLDAILRLLHPVMPFVTEAIFEQLSKLPAAAVPGVTLGPPRKAGLLCTAGWPEVEPDLRDGFSEAEFERLRSLITAVREVRAQHKVLPKRRITLHVPADLDAALKPHTAMLLTLGTLDRVTTDPAPAAHAAFRFETGELRASNLADAATLDTGAERARLEKQIADLERSVATLTARLSNPGYADRAPPAMVQQTRDQLAKAESERDAARAALAKIPSGS